MTSSNVIGSRLVCRHTRIIFARVDIPTAYFSRVSNPLRDDRGNPGTTYRADLPLHIHTCDAQEKRTLSWSWKIGQVAKVYSAR